MKERLTKKDYQILYQLLNDHLNTIGEIMVTRLRLEPSDDPEDSYLYQMERIEQKLARHI
jgi:hypothetical protein